MRRLLEAPVSAPPAAPSAAVATPLPYVGPRARKFVPYAERVAYAGSGRHHVSARRVRSIEGAIRWASSRLRDLGDALVGAWAPVVGA